MFACLYFTKDSKNFALFGHLNSTRSMALNKKCPLTLVSDMSNEIERDLLRCTEK